MQSFDLNHQPSRLQFALEMYNLASVLKDREGDKANKKVKGLRDTVNHYSKNYNLPTFYSGKGKRKRSRADDAGRSGGGQGPAHGSGSTANQLEAHGYKLVPDSFEDEHGTWEPLITVQPRNCFLISH